MSECRKQCLSVSERLGVLWCRLMHGSPMWPIRGRYRCRTCGRSHLIVWAAGLAETAADATKRGKEAIDPTGSRSSAWKAAA